MREEKMNLKNVVVFLVAVLVAVSIGCGGKKTVYPDSPATATGASDAAGSAEMEVGPFNVIVHVVDIYDQPVPGINVSVYLLKDHVMAIASDPDDAYFPNLALATYEDAQENAKPGFYPYPGEQGSMQATADTDIEITIVVENSGLASNGFEVEPEHMAAIETDEWINPEAQDYDMSGFYTLTGNVDFSGGTFVHLTSDVSYATGAGRQTASFLVDRISDLPTFLSLIGLELRIFGGDTLHTRQLNYMEGTMPILVVDDIAMVRDFWMQFTLTWDQNPADLDSHMWTPVIDGYSYHVYYASRGDSASAPFVDLDVDDVTSYGPEHITIYDEFPGTYTYAIYHYSGSGDITTSGAEVGILDPDGGVQAFDVPEASAAANWWWHVCTIDGTTGVITPVNIISADPPLPYAAEEDLAKNSID
jgi:hypothetical protein